MSAYMAAKRPAWVSCDRPRTRDARGIRANAVAPISVRTGDNLHDMGPTTRYVEREEVAGAVLFLCSAEARSITGQIFRLAD